MSAGRSNDLGEDTSHAGLHGLRPTLHSECISGNASSHTHVVVDFAARVLALPSNHGSRCSVLVTIVAGFAA